MKSRGILLCNLGGPTKLSEVRPFLFRLFSDPDILVGIPGPIRLLLAFLIVLIKGPSSIRSYKKIGGGSPQVYWTKRQAQALQSRLKGIPVVFGMRAWKPTLGDALADLKKHQVDEIVVLPLFPHFSTTTTGSCFKEIQKQLKKMKWSPAIKWVDRWPDHPGYVELLLKTLKEKQAAIDPSEKTHLMITAHSLPQKIIDRGDPYPSDIDRTVRALSSKIKGPWSLAFQSRNGPVPWLKPYVETEIPRLAQEGTQSLIVLPISFVSDHIETLFELDQEYLHLAQECGIKKFLRTRAFNDDPEFIECLAEIIECLDNSTGKEKKSP